MPKIPIIEGRFNQFVFEAIVPIGDWKVEGDLGLNLSLMLGYDFVTKGFRRIPIDLNRGLMVSTQGVKSNSNAITNPTIATSSTEILATNLNRNKVYLKNTGLNKLHITLGVLATVAFGYMLKIDEELILDNYTGVISGIAVAGASSLSVLELSRSLDE